MGKRTDVLWRIVALGWSWLLGIPLSLFLLFVGVPFMVVDMLWQLIFGTEGLSAKGRVGSALGSSVKWTADMNVYAMTGAGRFTWLPSF